MTVHHPQPARPSAPQDNPCSISYFLASWVAQEDWYCTHIVHQCCDQLTAVKTGYPLTSITWPYRGLRCRPIKVEYLFEVIRWQVTSFQVIAGSSLIHMKYVVFYMCRTIKILISKWPRKLKFSQFLQAEKTCQLLLTFLNKVTRWLPSTSNFYALIGQNLTGEFMRKIYAASWNLFTLTAEADRVLCQLVMFLTVFLRWMYKMKFCCYQESSVIRS